MEYRPDQFTQQLSGNPQPVYLIAGQEPLLAQEAADALRHYLGGQGYTERDLFHVDASFNWGELHAAGSAMSLFAEQKIIELRLPENGPGREGSKAISEFLAKPPPDTILFLYAPILDSKTRKSAWYKKVSEGGAAVYCWGLKPQEVSQWIRQRMQGKGLQAERDVVQVLADLNAGNLLAAAQEIDKLALLFPNGQLSIEQIKSAAADSAHFDVFDLPDKILSGAGESAIRILDRLREAGVEPVIIIAILSRDLRTLNRMIAGENPRSLGIWSSRQSAFSAAAWRLKATGAQRLLQRAARLDRLAKGAASGSVWDELIQLTALGAGLRVPAYISH